MSGKCFIGESEGPGSGRVRRNWVSVHGLKSCEGSERGTLWKNWATSVKEFKNRKCLGERHLTKRGKISEFKYITYGQTDTQIRLVKSGLVAIGLLSREHVGIYSKNRSEWVIADLAAQSHGCCSVPLYDTLGADAVTYVLNHADCVTCFTELDGLDNVMAAEAEKLRSVVVFPPRKFAATKKALEEYESKIAKYAESATRKVYRYTDIIKMGNENLISTDVESSGSDRATICYTSGTTGVPKGVVLTHNQMMSDVIHGVMWAFPMQNDDAYLSYLPLAHMYERAMITSVLTGGCSVGFFRGDVTLLLEDVALLKPTIFAGVPRLYNRIYDKIMAGVNESGYLKRKLFSWALSSKTENLRATGALTSRWDFAFKKVREALGGRVRCLTTGSAPISVRVMEFLRVAFSAPVVEGYGQTETAAAATVTLYTDQGGSGFVGVPLPCCEVKLVDVPDMNYTTNDVVDGKKVERGEICFRGTNIFNGYWKMPEKTEATIDKQGWLHSGDIGMWLPNGYLKIIDRKKNIFKLAQGEYVAPEKIENVYTTSTYIAQAFIYGNSLKPSLVGVLVPDEETVLPWCKQNGVKAKTLAEAVKSKAVRQLISDELRRTAIEGKLLGFEQAKEFHLHDELFSVENAILTPTFKLKRNEAKKKFITQIDAMYEVLDKKPKRSKL